MLAAGMLLMAAGSAVAGWEAGTKLGFDSNVGRSIHGGKSDAYLLAYGGFSREPSGESRGDWVFSASAEGAAFASVTDLDYAAITLSPGLVYFPHAGWTITVAPILQAKTVKDSDQSAVAFGGKIEVRERLGEKAYLAEHYAYRDSRATSDIFSYKEHAVGALLGVNWTPALSSEIGYEFSRGDSFLSVGTSTATSGGMVGIGGEGDARHVFLRLRQRRRERARGSSRHRRDHRIRMDPVDLFRRRVHRYRSSRGCGVVDLERRIRRRRVSLLIGP